MDKVTCITPADPENPEFFVYSAYEYAGGPKLEKSVMNYAVSKFLHQIIPGYMIPLVVDDLVLFAEHILEKNRRLSPVKIKASNPIYIYDGNMSIKNGAMSITIGSQSLRLRLIKGKVQ